MSEGKSDLETFEQLNKKFNQLKEKGETIKASKTFKKLEHLYGYMSSEDKAKANIQWGIKHKK